MGLEPDDARLLAALLARQREEGASVDLPPGRLRALAAGRGAPLRAREAAALLASPVAREELALHLRLGRLDAERRRQAIRLAEAVANDPGPLVPLRAAAAPARGGSGDELIELGNSVAVLLVEPGPDAAAPYLLTLRLTAGIEGGAAGRGVELVEPGRDNLVWLEGRTDEAGVLHGVWTHVGLEPWRRPFASGLRLLFIDQLPHNAARADGASGNGEGTTRAT